LSNLIEARHKPNLFYGIASMRSVWGIVAFVCLGLFLAGCDPSRDSRYFREGIGTDLYWDGLPAATQLQDAYLANICSQAISPTARSTDTVSCDGLPLTPRNWGLLVQAGMNDIDLRCDAYLAWLYDRKSSKEPFLKELAVLGGATAAILKATEVSSTPIALTAIAFGLAADSFTNLDARLVNAVDYSTAGSVVRDNRTSFRANNLSLVIDNRPAAIYVLRSYLSICVPDTIEMSINNTLVVYHRAGPDALRVPPIALRMAPATASTSAAVRGGPISAEQTIGKQDRSEIVVHKEFAQILDPYDPQVHSVSFVSSLQKRMCVPATSNEIGSPGPVTKGLIAIFEASPHPKTNNNGKLDSKEIAMIQAQGACVAGGGRNYFEKLTYPLDDDGKDAVAQLIAGLNNVPGGAQLATTLPLDQVRDRIKKVRADPTISKNLKLQLPPELSDQVTKDFLLALPRPPSGG
jgi:hypothetical protein